jgi:hypothetical protein
MQWTGSLITGRAFFDRSYRYNRPPEAPPFSVRLVNPARSITRVLNANEQVFNRLLQRGMKMEPALLRG